MPVCSRWVERIPSETSGTKTVDVCGCMKSGGKGKRRVVVEIHCQAPTCIVLVCAYDGKPDKTAVEAGQH